jgi:hypothetical protein
MNYDIQTMNVAGKRLMCFVFKEDNGVLGTFFNGDVREFHDEIAKQIDRVLSGKAKTVESAGNECEWLIRGDFCTIVDHYALDEKRNWFAVDTKTLRGLIDEWTRKNAEFRSAEGGRKAE